MSENPSALPQNVLSIPVNSISQHDFDLYQKDYSAIKSLRSVPPCQQTLSTSLSVPLPALFSLTSQSSRYAMPQILLLSLLRT